MSYALALHTSSPDLGLAINNFCGDGRSQAWDLDRNLSNYLHQYLAEFLAPQTWNELKFVAIAQGPGSFTSTRIGVVTARTLAQHLNCPLFAISSLAAFAWSIRSLYPMGTTLALQMPATRGQVYTAIYRVIQDNLYIDLPDTLMSLETWQESLESLASSYQLVELPTHLGNTVSSLLELADQEWKAGKRPHWETIFPFYG